MSKFKRQVILVIWFLVASCAIADPQVPVAELYSQAGVASTLPQSNVDNKAEKNADEANKVHEANVGEALQEDNKASDNNKLKEVKAHKSHKVKGSNKNKSHKAKRHKKHSKRNYRSSTKKR